MHMLRTKALEHTGKWKEAERGHLYNGIKAAALQVLAYAHHTSARAGYAIGVFKHAHKKTMLALSSVFHTGWGQLGDH